MTRREGVSSAEAQEERRAMMQPLPPTVERIMARMKDENRTVLAQAKLTPTESDDLNELEKHAREIHASTEDSRQ